MIRYDMIYVKVIFIASHTKQDIRQTSMIQIQKYKLKKIDLFRT